MRGSINGLKTLILQQSPSAYYVHCFAHQLQFTLVAVSKNNETFRWLLDILGILLNLIGSSPKRKEILRQKRAQHLEKALELGEIQTGTGQNQEQMLSRPGETRWGSYFKTILSVMSLFPTIIEVLGAIGAAGHEHDEYKAESITFSMRSFHFAFVAHLMVSLYGITNELNLALQKRDQDIVNAMDLVDATKNQLQELRESGWDALMEKVVSFCGKYKIDVVNLEDTYFMPGRSKRHGREMSNMHHFRVYVFLNVIDLQMQEIESHFDEVSRDLLICMSCFKPLDGYSSFNIEKLTRLAKMYPSEFSEVDLMYFEFQLGTFIHDIRNDERFSNLKNHELSMKLVETKKHLTHSKVYQLLKLVLVLPVATASVEMSFSAMTYIKNKVRNSMGNQLLNDNLVCFLERDLFQSIKDEVLITRFQNMQNRRLKL